MLYVSKSHMVTSKQQTACPIFDPFFLPPSQKGFSVSFDNGPHTSLLHAEFDLLN